MTLRSLNLVLGSGLALGVVLGGMIVKGYDSRSVATEPVFSSPAPQVSELVRSRLGQSDPSLTNPEIVVVPDSLVSNAGITLETVRVLGSDDDGPIAFLIIVGTLPDGSVHIGGGTYAQ